MISFMEPHNALISRYRGFTDTADFLLNDSGTTLGPVSIMEACSRLRAPYLTASPLRTSRGAGAHASCHMIVRTAYLRPQVLRNDASPTSLRTGVTVPFAVVMLRAYHSRRRTLRADNDKRIRYMPQPRLIQRNAFWAVGAARFEAEQNGIRAPTKIILITGGTFAALRRFT